MAKNCKGCYHWRLFCGKQYGCHYFLDENKLRNQPAEECTHFNPNKYVSNPDKGNFGVKKLNILSSPYYGSEKRIGKHFRKEIKNAKQSSANGSLNGNPGTKKDTY